MTNAAQWPILFGNYLLDGPIGHGGMARLFRARLRGVSGFEKPLAIKQMKPELARDPRFVKLFVEEARTLVRLGHPHIVTVYELGVVDGVYFLAMEHVEGASLAELAGLGPLAPEVVAHIGSQAADALAHAHGRHGLVHRDVTPRNVLVDLSGHVRVVDFGIAAYAGEGHELGIGSPGYMAPEQLRKEAVGGEADVFALGATLYFTATGTHAFYEADLGRAKRRVLAGELPTLDALPEALGALIARCLAHAPHERPSAASLAASLRAYVAHDHPEGVAVDLAARVARALSSSAGEARAQAVVGSLLTDEAPHTVRTLAASEAMRAVQGTEPGDAQGPRTSSQTEPSTAPMTAPMTQQDARGRPSRAGYLVMLMLLGLVFTLASVRAREASPPRSTRTSARVLRAPSEQMPATRSPSSITPRAQSALDTRHAPPLDEAIDERTREAPPQSPRAAQGTLSVAATPWAEVRIDGRSVGRTPRRALPLPAGTHTIELSCPPLGKSARSRVRIEAGALTRVVADLNASPPEIRVR